MTQQLYTVIGGAGFVGRHIVQKLAQAGHRVRVAVRNPQQALFLKPLGSVGQIQIVQANVRDAASIARAVAGADGVINCCGILHQGGRQSFHAVQARGAAVIAQAAKAAGAARLVHLSAIGADANSNSVYAQSKAAGEAGVRAAFPQATILRPSIIFGPSDGFFCRFARMASLSPVLPVIAGATRFQPVYVGDVAQAAVSAVTGAVNAAGKTFELGGPQTWSFRDLLAYVLKVTGRSNPLVSVPMPLARLLAAVLGVLPNPPLTLDQLRLLGRDNVVAQGAPGLADLGIQPTPVESVVPGCLVHFRPHGQFTHLADA